MTEKGYLEKVLLHYLLSVFDIFHLYRDIPVELLADDAAV